MQRYFIGHDEWAYERGKRFGVLEKKEKKTVDQIIRGRYSIRSTS